VRGFALNLKNRDENSNSPDLVQVSVRTSCQLDNWSVQMQLCGRRGSDVGQLAELCSVASS
jgi:hypothetical protein